MKTPPVKPFNIETFSIDVGINLHMIKTNKFKNTIICLLLRRPLKREDATINALIPRILSRGSSKYENVSKINSTMEYMYGSVFDAQIIKKGEEQIVQFMIDIINNDEDLKIQALEFLEDICMHPITENGGFKTSYTESEKELLKIDINSRKNDKAEYAKLRCLEEMCKEEAFGVYGNGYLEDIDLLTPQSIFNQYNKICETSLIEFIVAGNEDQDFFIKNIRKIFNFRRSNIFEPITPEVNANVLEINRVEENMDITQGKICIGLRTGVKSTGNEFYKLMLLNEILGGSGNSRLFLNVREKESLCYYINSFVYRFKTIMFVQSGVERENFERVIEVVKQEIDNLKKKRIGNNEYESAKSSLIKKYQGIQDYQSSIIDFSISQKMLQDEDTIENVIKEIGDIRKNDLIDIAQGLKIDTIYTLSR